MMGITPTLVEMATDVVVAQIRVGLCPPDVIAQLLHSTHTTLLALSRREATPLKQGERGAEALETLAALRQRPLATLQCTQVICLECGKGYRLLSSRHLVLHGLTAQGYKKKWHIPLTQALSAKSLTKRRRRKAKARDAGQYLAAWRAERRQYTE
jgi:predicted transcriptional regulator